MQRSLYLASRRFLIPQTPLQTYQTAVEEAIKLAHAEEGVLFVKNLNGLQTAYATSRRVSWYVPIQGGLIYDLLQKQKAIVLTAEEMKKQTADLAKIRAKSLLCISLVFQNQPLGILMLFSFKKNSVFSKNHLETLTLFGQMATLAIKNSKLLEENKNALERRDAFISHAAHELKTPLTSINGYVQLLYAKLKGHKGSEGKWIRELFKESQRLIAVVKESLQVGIKEQKQ